MNEVIVFQNHSIQISWKNDSELLSAEKVVEKCGKIVGVKKDFVRGLAENDDIILQTCVKELSILREAADVDDSYCSSEFVKAVKVVNTAAEAFNELLNGLNHAIVEGALTVSKPTSISVNTDTMKVRNIKALVCDVSVTTSFSTLEAALKAYDSRPSMSGSSRKTSALVLLCRKLCELRKLAVNSSWSEIWKLLPTWDCYVKEAKKDYGPLLVPLCLLMK